MKIEAFLEKAKRIFGDRYDYSKVYYINNKTKIIIICKIHGEFLQSPQSHLKGYNCKSCSKIITANKKSITKEEFFARVNKKHNFKYDYSKVNFNKLKQNIIIICPIHGEFNQRASSHFYNGCINCRDDSYRRSVKEVIDKANLIHDNKYSYIGFTYYKNNKQILNILCKTHGIFHKIVADHLNGSGCDSCNIIIHNDNAYNDFITKANIIHSNEYKYINNNFHSSKKINVICNAHGEFRQNKSNHISGSKCPKCVKINRRLTLDEFLVKANLEHNNKYDYSKVKFDLVKDKISIICYKHGEFLQRVAPHLYKKHGCPNCSKIISKDETEWLDYIKLPNEFRNKRLFIKDKYFFPDGFDINTNTVYEYYGDYWHGNLNIYSADKINKLNKMKFKDLYDRTINRENFIKSNGYNIVSIWESDWLNIKKNLR